MKLKCSPAALVAAPVVAARPLQISLSPASLDAKPIQQRCLFHTRQPAFPSSVMTAQSEYLIDRISERASNITCSE